MQIKRHAENKGVVEQEGQRDRWEQRDRATHSLPRFGRSKEALQIAHAAMNINFSSGWLQDLLAGMIADLTRKDQLDDNAARDSDTVFSQADAPLHESILV